MVETPPAVDGSTTHLIALGRKFPLGGDPDLSEGQYLTKPEELRELFEGICNIFGDIKREITVEKDGEDITDYVFDREWEKGSEGETAGNPASHQ